MSNNLLKRLLVRSAHSVNAGTISFKQHWEVNVPFYLNNIDNGSYLKKESIEDDRRKQ